MEAVFYLINFGFCTFNKTSAMKKILVLFSLILCFACKEKTSEEKIPVEPNNGIGDGATPPPVFSFAENIEEAHNKTAFRNKEAVSFDIVLEFGGKTRLDGKVSMTTNSTKVRLDRKNGVSVIYDGNKVAITPDTAAIGNSRFDVFTWQYFFAMPFKLTDAGTVWEEEKMLKLDSTKLETAKLSFESSIGDSPDDWYVVYKDPETERLKAAAYIVTFNKEQQKAEENPHAIVYSSYKMVDNVAFATQWSFHNWNSEEGLGEKLGEATISNIRFFDPENEYFKIPENSKPVEK